jgi:hypothetical protein
MWIPSFYCGKFVVHRPHVPFAFYLFAFPPLYPEHLLFVPIIVSLPERSLADHITAAVQFPFNQSSLSQFVFFLLHFIDFASLGSFASLMLVVLNYPVVVILLAIPRYRPACGTRRMQRGDECTYHLAVHLDFPRRPRHA